MEQLSWTDPSRREVYSSNLTYMTLCSAFLSNGTAFDTTEQKGRKPLSFRLGKKQVSKLIPFITLHEMIAISVTKLVCRDKNKEGGLGVLAFVF